MPEPRHRGALPSSYVAHTEHHLDDELGNSIDVYAPINGNFVHAVVGLADLDGAVELLLDADGARALAAALVDATGGPTAPRAA